MLIQIHQTATTNLLTMTISASKHLKRFKKSICKMQCRRPRNACRINQNITIRVMKFERCSLVSCLFSWSNKTFSVKGLEDFLGNVLSFFFLRTNVRF